VNIRQNREKNTSAVKEQKILVENEIRELRRKIDKHLDKLQESLMKELTEKEKGITVISFSTNIFCSLTALVFFSLFCLILPIVSINSSINCSISLNKLEVFIFLIIFSRLVKLDKIERQMSVLLKNRKY
jgi:hypothetical protein